MIFIKKINKFASIQILRDYEFISCGSISKSVHHIIMDCTHLRESNGTLLYIFLQMVSDIELWWVLGVNSDSLYLVGHDGPGLGLPFRFPWAKVENVRASVVGLDWIAFV